MPSKPRTEPTLEELSAYLDHELDPGDQARVAEHVATCADCQARLDGLRQTAYAIRGLPQETPPRTFTVPQQARRPAWNWAPVGWIGGLAAAVVIVIIGVTHLPSGGSTASSGGVSGGLGLAAPYSQQAPAPAAGSAPNQDSQLSAQKATAFANSVTVVDTVNGQRRLVVGSDASTYSASATLRVRVILQGAPSTSTSAQTQGLSVALVRKGSGVDLSRGMNGVSSWDGTPVFGGTYAIARLPLSQPVPGTYTLIATWTIPDGSGRVLQASVPITITAG